MPELPEVETIRRGLEGAILKKRIKAVRILNAGSWRGDAESVAGHVVVKLERRGKALLIGLDDATWLMIHLRMTGQLVFVAGDGERMAGGHPNEDFVASLPNAHTRVYLEFEDGGKLFFNDLRKFGFVAHLTEAELAEDVFLAKLAPEPWALTPDVFYEMLQRHRETAIKAVLLDQHCIAGLGNIYADEACFEAGIAQWRKAGDVSREEAERLLLAARSVMELAIEAGGSTLKDYVKADGSRGNYLEKYVKAYGRKDEPCVRCGSPVRKTKVAGRGTYYCEHCQR